MDIKLRPEELEALRNLVGECSDPEEVFPDDRLAEWATDHGYVHKSQISEPSQGRSAA